MKGTFYSADERARDWAITEYELTATYDTFLTPTDFDFESYHVANQVFKKVFGVFYDDVIR